MTSHADTYWAHISLRRINSFICDPAYQWVLLLPLISASAPGLLGDVMLSIGCCALCQTLLSQRIGSFDQMIKVHSCICKTHGYWMWFIGTLCSIRTLHHAVLVLRWLCSFWFSHFSSIVAHRGKCSSKKKQLKEHIRSFTGFDLNLTLTTLTSLNTKRGPNVGVQPRLGTFGGSCDRSLTNE